MCEIITKEFLLEIAIIFVKIGILFGAVMALAGILTWAERKMSALMQDRVGPNRASIFGFSLWGLFHPAADGIKMVAKEDFVPDKADKVLFTLAPMLALVPVFVILAFIPFGDYLQIGNLKIQLQISDLPLSLFLFLAISSLAIYGAFLGGWSAKNNFGLLGAVRAAAQMISYEVVLGLTLVGIILVYGSGSIQEIVKKQGEMLFGFLPSWGIVYQFPAFILFLVAAVAENKRTPFDIVEGESEIIGYFVEYSSMRFAMFMFSEFAEIVVVSMIASALFLGGWQVPFLNETGFAFPGGILITINHNIVALIQTTAFAGKTVFMAWLLLLIRWTLPRFRFDQLMKLCWKGLLPLSLANIVLTSAILQWLGSGK